jgi:hypothetical protein
MRELKKYALKENPPQTQAKLDKRATAVLEVLKGGPKNAKEIHAALGKYTLGGVGAALSALRKAGVLDDGSAQGTQATA